MTTDRMRLRELALQRAFEVAAVNAANLQCPRPILASALLKDAAKVFAWLTQPVELHLTFSTPTPRAGQAVAFDTSEGALVPNLELGDSDQVTATATPLDENGQPTTDTLSWSASTPSAVTLTPSANTLQCLIAGAVPTPDVTITATDSLGNVTTGVIDVVAGPAASLSLQFGPVTPQPSATPAPAAGDTGSGTAPTADAGSTDAGAGTPAA